MCRYYDTRVNNSCREPIAEKVNDKTRANFCGYLQPQNLTQDNDNTLAQSNQASLESLFDLEQGSTKLSGSDADEALQELGTLFGLDDHKKN